MLNYFENISSKADVKDEPWRGTGFCLAGTSDDTTNEMQQNKASASDLSQEMALVHKNIIGGDFEPRGAWANRRGFNKNFGE